MLTPQEVAEHAFAKASFGGYNMAMVDEFLDLLTNDYTTLYKENAALKTKMKVLADKVEEYRATEDAMRKALLTAQKMADQMVADAETKKAKLLEEAEKEAKEKTAALNQEVNNEAVRLTAAQNATAAYIAKLKDLYQHEMEYLASLSQLTAPVPQPDRVAQAADAAAAAVEEAVKEEIAEAPAPEVPAAEETAPEAQKESLYEELKKNEASVEEIATSEEDDAPTRRIDFEHLQFGKDYEIE